MKGCVVWLTGLPASGKTTLSHLIQARLRQAGVAACLLDGDVMRAILTPHLGYTEEARAEFYGVLARLAAELAGQDLVVLVPATAHRREYRQRARELAPRFVEVWVSTPLEECRRRDPKGLYAGAEKVPGHLPGVDLAYEAPLGAEVQASGGGDVAAVDHVLALVVAQAVR